MAKKSLTKTQFEQEFTDKINTQLDLTLKRKDGATIIGCFRQTLLDHATDEHGISYSGFLKCSVVQTKPRNGRNPATGEAIKIPSKIRGKILCLKAFKDELAEIGKKAFGSKKNKKADKAEKKSKKADKSAKSSKKADKKSDKKAAKSKKKSKK